LQTAQLLWLADYPKEAL
jgi:hypothetical protein